MGWWASFARYGKRSVPDLRGDAASSSERREASPVGVATAATVPATEEEWVEDGRSHPGCPAADERVGEPAAICHAEEQRESLYASTTGRGDGRTELFAK